VSDFVIVLVLVLLAALLAGIELVRTRGQAMMPWAILVLALAILVDKL
jgi:hypothetical protein